MTEFKRAHRMDLPPSITFSMDHGTIEEADLETPQSQHEHDTDHTEWLDTIAVEGHEQGWGL